MGIWMVGLLAVCLFSGVAAPAKAGLRMLSYTGTLSLQIGLTGENSLPSVTLSGGAVAPAVTYGGHLSTLVIPGGAFGPISTWLPVTSGYGTIQSVRFTGLGNLPATLTGISGGPPLGSGAMGVQGVLKVCIFTSACTSSVQVPFTPSGGAGLGIGGTQFVGGGVALTLQHAPWTIGQPAMTIHSPNSNVTIPALPGGFAHGPASLTSSTARLSGVIQLVTASKVYTSLTTAWPELPVMGVLSLHVVPEPGTLLLLGSGVVGLGLFGHRRRGR
jgi:hypothetical protein